MKRPYIEWKWACGELGCSHWTAVGAPIDQEPDAPFELGWGSYDERGWLCPYHASLSWVGEKADEIAKLDTQCGPYKRIRVVAL